MAALLLRRVLSAALLLLASSILAHILLLPGADDVARNILGDAASEAQVTAKTRELGLDRPLPEQYANWLKGAVTGDLGRSFFSSQSVADAVSFRMPVTISLVLLVTVLTGLIAFGVGMLAAVRGGWVDRSLQIVTTLGDGLPAFLIGVFLVSAFALQLGWLPATGYVPLAESPSGWAASLVLPVAAMTITGVAGVAQHVRSATLGVLGSDYVRTRRSRGLSGAYVLRTTVLRSSATTGLAALGVQVTAILGGAVIVEQVFALPGLGFLGVQSATRSDVPMMIGVLMAFVVVIVTVNLVVDLVVAWINPKVRLDS